MAIRKLAHYSVRTQDLEASRWFYAELLGLKVGFRPPFEFPGFWLYCDEDEAELGVVHLIGLDNAHAHAVAKYLADREKRDGRHGPIRPRGISCKRLDELAQTM